jgi:hypothetical protein
MLRALQSHAPNKRIYPRLVEYFLRQGYSKSMALLAFHRHSQSLVPSHSLFLAPLLWDYPHLGALHYILYLVNFVLFVRMISLCLQSVFLFRAIFCFFSRKKSGKFSKNVFSWCNFNQFCKFWGKICSNFDMTKKKKTTVSNMLIGSALQGRH